MEFISRHLGPDAAEREEMLAEVGYDSVEDLVKTAIPDSIQAENLPDLSLIHI